jgi:hypothetical protein
LTKRLDELTQHQRLNLSEAGSRLRFPAIGARAPGDLFSTVASATLQRQKLFIEYHARSTDTRSERTISPQRITHYRDTWYLDAWDDDKDALRSFSIDRIRRAVVVDGEAAFDVEERELDEHYASAYGIFGGKADKVAVLRFNAERARWVADEMWHPQQEGRWLEDGRYELRIPYRESRELVMDVLRHGADVEVFEPTGCARQWGTRCSGQSLSTWEDGTREPRCLDLQGITAASDLLFQRYLRLLRIRTLNQARQAQVLAGTQMCDRNMPALSSDLEFPRQVRKSPSPALRE